MRFTAPLIPGRFVRRYKRFFADVRLDDGRIVVSHCPNPGSMKSCLVEGARVWLSRSENPRRALEHTWEVLQLGRTRVFVNPVRTNHVVASALGARAIPELSGYAATRREVRTGRSRIDFMLTDPGECYVEVKNVTLGLGRGRSAFPDSVTERGVKHLEDLAELRLAGKRAVLLFCASRTDTRSVEPADDIDPRYGYALRAAVARGVEVYAYRARVTTRLVELAQRVPVLL